MPLQLVPNYAAGPAPSDLFEMKNPAGDGVFCCYRPSTYVLAVHHHARRQAKGALMLWLIVTGVLWLGFHDNGS